MTVEKEKLLTAIYAAIDALNETLPLDRQIAKTPRTLLWGPDSGVDSLGITLLVVGMEQKLSAAIGRPVSLTGLLIRPAENNPLLSVDRLTDFLAQNY